MEERDARPSQHAPSSSLPPPQPALPSMHAPHITAVDHHHHQQIHAHQRSYAPPQHTQYATVASASQHPQQQQQQQQHHQQQQQQFYDSREPHVPAQQDTHYNYHRSAAAAYSNTQASVSLPPIQHLHGPGTATVGPSTTNMSMQPNLPAPAPPPPLPHQQAIQHTQQQHGAHAYPLPHAEAEVQSAYDIAAPPGRVHPGYRQPPLYQPQYAPNQYNAYANGAMHQQPPPVPAAMMPSNMPNGAMRYGLQPNPQLGPRQMSGGRHQKEVKRRTKTGCLTCRKRRIKCDERHPHCRNCEKSKRECLGYDPVFKSQPAPAPLQPAPLPGQVPKPDPQAYHMGYSYQGGHEDMYASRPPPPTHSEHAPSSMNGNADSHNGGPLTDGDPNRGQSNMQEGQPEPISKDLAVRRSAWMSVDTRAGQ